MGEKNIKHVVGLKYEQQKGPPQIVVKAHGQQAEALLKQQRSDAHAPPIIKDPALTEALYRLPTDSKIPAELYEVAAALLIHFIRIPKP